MPDTVKLTRIRQKIGEDIVVMYPETVASQVLVGTGAEQTTLDAKLSTMDGATQTAISTANAYTDGKIADLINGAPAALQTLDALAEALGDDANFATTITTALAGKAASDHNHDTVYLALTGGTVTGQISTPTTTTYATLDNANLVNKGQAETRLSDFALTSSLRQSFVSATQPATLNEGDLWFEVTNG